jgi:hypothetical protein
MEQLKIDMAQGADDGHPGIKKLDLKGFIGSFAGTQTVLVNNDAIQLNYYPVTADTIKIEDTSFLDGNGGILYGKFQIFTRSSKPLPNSSQAKVTSNFLTNSAASGDPEAQNQKRKLSHS